MDFIDEIRALGKNIPSISGKILTEEGTKNALVMPFIRILGYDPSNLDEVTPELVADIGTKKGEKVDYAILKDGKPVILFECKTVNTDLTKEHSSQLYRYFDAIGAHEKVGVLTNGVIYKFFTDLEDTNKMDKKPFLEINLLDIKEPLIAELKKFSKQELNLDQLESNATQLKYTREIIQKLNDEFSNPSELFVKFFADEVYPKKYNKQAKEKFAKITKDSLNQFLDDKISERLKSAAALTSAKKDIAASTGTTPQPIPEIEDEGKLVTTDDEWEGFYFVKAILHDVLDASRIFMRDAKSYCAILLDDNNRQTICRLYFNSKQKYVGVFDNEKKAENKIPINNLNELFKLAEHFKGAVAMYEKKQ
jgi:predicted type IV restriction endonuclease